MLELDLLLQGFLDQAYTRLSEAERRRFETLLECADQDLLEWLMGRAVHHDKDIDALIQTIRHTAGA